MKRGRNEEEGKKEETTPEKKPKSEPVFEVKPIGRVAVGASGFSLQVDAAFAPALEGLEGFSHVQVVWWGHKSDTKKERETLQVDKPYKRGPDRMGVFATRSPARPNPMNLSVSQVLGVDPKTGVVKIAWIDAEIGTPILDIKPYHPSMDRLRDAGVPAWCKHWPSWMEDSGKFDWASEFNY